MNRVRRLGGSFRARLVFGYVVVVALFGIAWAWNLYGPITRGLVEQQEKALRSAAAATSVLLEQGVPAERAAAAMGEAEDVRITIVAADGSVLADSTEDPASMENHGGRPEVAAALRGERDTQQRVSRTEGSEQMYVAVPGTLDDERVAVRASEEVAAIAAVVSRSRRSGVLLLGLSIILATAFASSLSRGLAEPVERLSAAAKRMASGDLGADIPAPEGELGVMSDALRELRNQIRWRIDALEAERRTLDTALDGLPDAVMLLEDDRIVYANSSTARLFGVRRDRLSGRTLADSGLPAALAARIGELAAAGSSTAEETSPDPIGRSHMVTMVPLLPTGGGRTLAVIEDTTERSRIERMRRDFVANASHELKTPVAGIQLLAESAVQAAEDGDGIQAVAFATQIVNESTRLRRLVADLLDLSRLETAPAADAVTDVRDVVANAMLAHQPAAQSRGLELRLEAGSVAGVDVYAHADPTDLAVAMDNLLDNAIAYTDEGAVTVGIRATIDEVSVSVADTGVGIPPSALPRLFERFYRVDGARSRESGGTGLGLALVRHAIERSGGRVSVTSEVDRGSEFTVVLPRAV